MPGTAAMEEIRIRTSYRLGVVALAVAVLGTTLAVAYESFRLPFFYFVLAALFLSGALLLLDRRVKLVLSPAGIRYSECGPAVVPWEEFSGYRWARWRGQPSLQLLPRRPTELTESLSAYGKLSHACRGLARMPQFAISVTRLGVSSSRLEEHVARFLPALPPE